VAADVSAPGLGDGRPLSVGLRPEHLIPSDAGIRARVEASEILGAETVIHAALQSGERIVASLRGIQRVTAGQTVGFTIDPEWVHVFDENGDAFARPAPVSEIAYGFGTAR
jgi:ABC-type sugar transport system ATPase subunit